MSCTINQARRILSSAGISSEIANVADQSQPTADQLASLDDDLLSLWELSHLPPSSAARQEVAQWQGARERIHDTLGRGHGMSEAQRIRTWQAISAAVAQGIVHRCQNCQKFVAGDYDQPTCSHCHQPLAAVPLAPQASAPGDVGDDALDPPTALYYARIRKSLAAWLNSREGVELRSRLKSVQLINITYDTGVSGGQCQACGKQNIKYEFHLEDSQTGESTSDELIVGSECIYNYTDAAEHDTVDALKAAVDKLKAKAREDALAAAQMGENAALFSWAARQELDNDRERDERNRYQYQHGRDDPGFLKAMRYRIELGMPLSEGQLAALRRSYTGVQLGRLTLARITQAIPDDAEISDSDRKFVAKARAALERGFRLRPEDRERLTAIASRVAGENSPAATLSSTKLVVLDRDGTLIALRPDPKHPESAGLPPNRPEDVRLIPGAAAAIMATQQSGKPVVILSNQGGLNLPKWIKPAARFDESLHAQGWSALTPAQHNAVHDEMLRQLEAAGVDVSVDKLTVLYCPHGTKSGCPCRKPEPGVMGGTAMFEQASMTLGLERVAKGRVVVVGDGKADYQLAHNLGATFILVPTGHSEETRVVAGADVTVMPLDKVAVALTTAARDDASSVAPSYEVLFHKVARSGQVVEVRSISDQWGSYQQVFIDDNPLDNDGYLGIEKLPKKGRQGDITHVIAGRPAIGITADEATKLEQDIASAEALLLTSAAVEGGPE